MAIELRVVQFWSEITRMISDQIALYSVNLPLFITESHCMHYIEMGGQGVNGGGGLWHSVPPPLLNSVATTQLVSFMT